MAKNPISMKELMKTKEVVEKERIPKYWVVQPKFMCPLSPSVMWHHGLVYSSCPLIVGQRDMPSCDKCVLRGDAKVIERRSEKHRKEDWKGRPKVEKREKGSVPNIGKAYTSPEDE